MLEDKCHESGTDMKIHIDVTKIVKYVCITGAFIVAVIFAAKCIGKCVKAE